MNVDSDNLHNEIEKEDIAYIFTPSSANKNGESIIVLMAEDGTGYLKTIACPFNLEDAAFHYKITYLPECKTAVNFDTMTRITPTPSAITNHLARWDVGSSHMALPITANISEDQLLAIHLQGLRAAAAHNVHGRAAHGTRQNHTLQRA